MAFRIRFLGTGTAFSRAADNYHNNAIIHTQAGPVMIDCGATAPQALHEMGIKPWEIVGIIITHLHGDHCGGIEQIAWERYYTGPSGPGFLKTPIFVHPDIGGDISISSGVRIHDRLKV
jgi:ribonuclease BN (tRNA processing enzyme)